MAYTIEIDELTKSYGDVPVLTGLDLAVQEGSVFALLGPNGAGKTTTVRILSTLLHADSGSARVAGFDAARKNLRRIARVRHLGRSAGRTRTDELLERFDLGEAADRRVATFSGGMKR